MKPKPDVVFFLCAIELHCTNMHNTAINIAAKRKTKKVVVYTGLIYRGGTGWSLRIQSPSSSVIVRLYFPIAVKSQERLHLAHCCLNSRFTKLETQRLFWKETDLLVCEVKTFEP